VLNRLTPDVESIVKTLMGDLDTPRSLAVKMLVENGEWVQLANLEVDPRRYTDPEEYWKDGMATELLRKCADFSDPSSLSLVTFNKWLWAESQCRRTNQRLSMLDLPRPLLTDVELALLSFLDNMRKVIEGIIGFAPPQYLPGRFGPGASVSDPSILASIPDKMSSVPTFTPNAWLELVPWAGTAWASAQAALGKSPRSVRGNVYFTVPKSAKILRACAKEPSINGYYQLGVGSFLKDCLRSVGVDLFNGQEFHCEMARKASLSGDFATIDLTSASDTVAHVLVKRVLPRRWFEHLDRLRSPMTLVNKKWYHLAKFSSMGNGYTFELETLIFYALIKTISPNLRAGVDLFVYGDDLIVPTDVASKVVRALELLGFTPNNSKTFLEGPFSESCGGDFFGGVGVRATYLEELPNEPQQFIALANALRRSCKAATEDFLPNRWNRVRRTWFRCLDCLPSNIRSLRGPEGLGDLVLHDTEERWQTRWRSSIRYIRSYRPLLTHKVRWEGFAYDVQMASALYGVPTNLPTKAGGFYPRVILVSSRQSTVGYKVGWVPHS